ncbi:hypothetical protein SLEP1_g59423 [Rubroshorea leprosula]|uniref:Uncharacterized protein n=1 Tax=Rubroshorea leprosula TaxID=152421 RepID=A0AAV5MTF7_9ROSI|nr:hypothetical protein SLEP1_g59423 [Rubroshorea leprosula]
MAEGHAPTCGPSFAVSHCGNRVAAQANKPVEGGGYDETNERPSVESETPTNICLHTTVLVVAF